MALDLVSVVNALAPLTKRVSLGLSLGIGFLLFVPEDWAPMLPLAEIRAASETDLTWGFALLSGVFIGHVAVDIAGPLRRSLSTWVSTMRFLAQWYSLDKREKVILGYLAETNSDFFHANRHWSTVQSLVDRGMLRASTAGEIEEWGFHVPLATEKGIRRFRSKIRAHFHKVRKDEQVEVIVKDLWELNEQPRSRMYGQ